MKVLYITPLFRGFEDVIKGDEEAKGLPTFIFPLKKLIEDGNSVDMILISNYDRAIVCSVDWVEKINIIENINNDLTSTNKFIKVKNTIKTFIKVYHTIDKAIRENDYDFVYCHSTAAVIGNILANKYGVPCGYRIYGTYKLLENIREKNKISAIVSNFKYYLIFKLRKEFLLVTDDGSQGDLVYNTWVKDKSRYKFLFWVNGVDIQPGNEIETDYKVPDTPYIFMAGRVERGKGQLKGIEVLVNLHKAGIKYHLYIAGHLDDSEYIERMRLYIKENKLQKYVHFLGPIHRDNLKKLSYYSKASLLWQDVSNAGSVFYEMFSSGAIIIARRDGSLVKFSKEDEDIFLVDTIEEASSIILNLDKKTDLERSEIKKAAITHAKTSIKSWNERISMEMELIYQYDK